VELQNRLLAYQQQHNIVELGQQTELDMRRVLNLEAARRENDAAMQANAASTPAKKLNDVRPRYDESEP